MLISPGRDQKSEQLSQGHTTAMLLAVAHVSEVRSEEEPPLHKSCEAWTNSRASLRFCPLLLVKSYSQTEPAVICDSPDPILTSKSFEATGQAPPERREAGARRLAAGQPRCGSRRSRPVVPALKCGRISLDSTLLGPAVRSSQSKPPRI